MLALLERGLAGLGVAPDDWDIRWLIGKSVFQTEKQPVRCYAGFRAVHRRSGRVLEGGEQGRFTQRQARKLALKLFLERLAASG